MGMLSLESRVMGKISKKTFSFCSIFILFSSVLAENSIKLTSFSENKSHTPHWEPLCDKGHQYLFSEETVDWSSALEMCQLLGGYLVRIENQHENNCLLVHAMKNGLHAWWWTSVNDVEIEGYYVFEDGTEVDWKSNWIEMTGAIEDGILFGTYNSLLAGAWSDDPISRVRPYICEKNDQ